MLLLLILSSFLNQVSGSVSSVDPILLKPLFNSGSCGQQGELLCWGSASVQDGYLDITPPLPQTNTSTSSLPFNSTGRVLYKNPVLAWPALIVTSFTVIISKYPNSTGSGDGIAFVIAEDNGPSPNNSFGSFLGLHNQTTIGRSINQLAVELDTYKNEWDIDDNHVGIDTKSVRDHEAAMSLHSFGIDLKLGRPVQIMIEYDVYRKELRISAAYSGDPLVIILNHSIMISRTVPRAVYVGFTGSTGAFLENHRILNWSFASFPQPMSSLNDGHKRHSIKLILIIGFPVITGFLVLGACTNLVALQACRSSRTSNGQDKEEDMESRLRIAANAPKLFTLNQLLKATHNFSRDNLLGVGGFGSVYKGVLSNPSSTIAVKKISATSKQGEREYLAEISTIGCLRHKNILQLQGWCHEQEHLLLVYEFMANSSLDRHISNGSLDWQTRYKILTGLASALLYLHEECGNNVVHRDVKPNNVMLDSDFNAHLGDFGLAMLLQDETAATTILAGTPGYLAPECSSTGKATPEADVYSFGIVVLEVVCGRRSKDVMESQSLVDHVWNLQEKSELLLCVDPKLGNKYEEDQVKRVLVTGLACSHPDPELRPKMRKVVQLFMNPDEPLVCLPESRPTSAHQSFKSSSASTSRGLRSSIASGSYSSMALPDEITVLHGR